MSIEEAASLISASIERKITKSYASVHLPSLLLYVNVGVFGLPYNAVIGRVLPAAAAFRSCWMISSQLIACVQSDEELGAFVGWRGIA